MPVEDSAENYEVGHPDHRETRQKYGKYLTRAAWGIEIIAASIGLFIAMVTIFATQSDILQEKGEVDARAWMNIFIAGLPFFMVAIVELMKIPMATAYYIAQSRMWRYVFLISLVFLIAVTFETMINGFQRQFESRVFLITEERTKVTNIEESISQLDSRIADLRETTMDTITSEHDRQIEQIRKETESAITSLEDRRREQYEQAGQTGTSALERERTQIEGEIKDLRRRQAEEIEQQRETYQSDASRNDKRAEDQRTALNEQLDRLDKNIAQIEEEYSTELRECTFFCSSVHERFSDRLKPSKDRRKLILDSLRSPTLSGEQDLRKELDSRIADVRDKYDQEIREKQARLGEIAQIIDNRTSRSEQKIQPIIKRIEDDMIEITAKSQRQIAEARQRFDARRADVENREQKIAEHQEKKNELELRRNEHRNLINVRAKDNQIYQIAALWFGREAPADVTKDELKFVSAIWFGSLAAIVALTGTILAFAGLVVRYHEPKPRDQSPNRKKAWRSVRRAAVVLRQHLRRRSHEGPRVVTKEIPVEKIVFRDVEREVVRKELVYVPLYTNDPELLKIWEGVKPSRQDSDETEPGEFAAGTSHD